MQVYLDIMRRSMFLAFNKEIPEQTAFRVVSFNMGLIEQRLAASDLATLHEFQADYGREINGISYALASLTSPTHAELSESLEHTVESLNRRGPLATSTNDEEWDETDQLFGIDEVLYTGIMGHRLHRPLHVDKLAKQSCELVPTLRLTKGIHSFATDRVKQPWNVVIKDTPIFGVWNDIASMPKPVPIKPRIRRHQTRTVRG